MSLPHKAQFHRHVRDLAALSNERDARPDVVVGTLLSQWCGRTYPTLTNARLPVSAALAKDPTVRKFTDFLASQPLLDGAYWLSSAYAMLADSAYRKRMAMFFTPPSLTQRLLDDLADAGVDFASRSFCDPACGGAAFLVPIAQRMRVALLARGASPREVIAHIESHLHGMDADEVLCALSQHFLLMVLHAEVATARCKPRFRIAKGDSLEALSAHFGTLDVLTCNPPYRKMAASEVARYRAHYSEVIESQPNLYALFMALCIKLLKPGGTCALVTPTSFLSGQYFSRLRTFLMSETRIRNIGMVSERFGVFIDVGQETALTLLQRGQGAAHSGTTTEVSVVSRSGTYVNVGQCALPNSGAAWPVPREEADVALLARAATLRYRLEDYGYSPRIGSFVWNRDTRPTYISAAMAKHHAPALAVPLLWSSDVCPEGTLRFDGKRKANREPCFVSLGSKSHPSVVRRRGVVLQRVTSNDQPRRLVAAPVPKRLLKEFGGYVGENHTVILEPTSDAPAFTPEEMTQLLGCPAVDRFFRCISGATNVSAFELGQLALPDPRALRLMLQQGHSMREAVASLLTPLQ